MTDDRLLRVSEACAYLAIGRTTLHELTRAGKLRKVRVGRRGVRYRLRELELYVAANTQGKVR